METPQKIPALSKALLAGVMAGIIATVINLIYNAIFRLITKFEPSEAINFLSITLATMLILIMGGIAYFFLFKNRDPKDRLFTIILMVLMVIGIVITLLNHEPGNSLLYGREGLMAGFILFGGLTGAFVIPYLFHHPRMFI